MAKHPMQTIYFDNRGVARFRKNKIVEFLLDHARVTGVNLNHIAAMDFDIQDRMQFSQLHGYFVSGFGDLYPTRKLTQIADNIVADMIQRKKK